MCSFRLRDSRSKTLKPLGLSSEQETDPPLDVIRFTGHYPERLTIVGYGMKAQRYDAVHRASIRWPSDRFRYVGIDNEGDTSRDYEGERRYGLEPYQRDRYGCHGKLLAKRKKRNPFRRFHGYHSSGALRLSEGISL